MERKGSFFVDINEPGSGIKAEEKSVACIARSEKIAEGKARYRWVLLRCGRCLLGV